MTDSPQDNIESEIDRRLAAVNSCYVKSPAIEEILLAIVRLRRFGFRSDGSAMCMQISGPTGSGKSMIFERYLRRPDARPEGDAVPVVRVAMPTPFSMAALADRLIDGVGSRSFSRRETLDTKVQRLRSLVSARETKLILVDDVQHIVDKKDRGARLPYYAADQIKTELLDGLRVPIAFNGTEASDLLYESNPQLEMRRFSRHVLMPFGWDDEGGRDRFSLMVALLATRAEFPNAQRLGPELLERVHFATGGVPGRINKLIRCATEIAVTKGNTVLDADLLAEANAVGQGGKDWMNVFRVPMSLVRNAGSVSDESRVTRLRKGIRRADNGAARQ